MSDKIAIERMGRHAIGFVGWPNKADTDRARTVPGAKLARGRWTFPLTVSTCHDLRATYGARLAIGNNLAAWYRAEAATAEAASRLTGATDAELAVIGRRPELAALAAGLATRGYQRVAARFLAELGSVLLADEQGLGKCIETLAANVEIDGLGPRRYLIVAPLIAVSSVWPGQIRQWLPGVADVVALDQPNVAARREALRAALAADHGERALYVVTNIEACRITPDADEKGKVLWHTANAAIPELFGVHWDAVVVDECHKALIRPSSTPTKTINDMKVKLGTTQTRAGMVRLDAGRRVALSGTPMRGKPNQLWGTLNWLRPDVYTSYWQWVEHYFNLTSNGFSSYVIEGLRPDGLEKMAADMRTISLRRTKAEVFTELPPKQYAGNYIIPGDTNSPCGIWLPENPAQRRQREQLAAEGVIKPLRVLPAGQNEEIIVNGTLAEYTRARQIANAPLDGNAQPVVRTAKNERVPKLEWLIAKLDELGIRPEADDCEGTGKIVVASESTRTVNAFARELRELGIPCFVLTGETPSKARAGMVEQFQSDQNDVRVFMLNSKAGGVGITLDAADDLVLLDEGTIPDDKAQVEDRVHRASRIHQVTIHQLRTLGTIEEEIAFVAAAREDVQRYLLDGSRGVDYARKLYESKRDAGELAAS